MVGEENVLEVGEVGADLLYFLVEGGSGDENTGVAVLEAITDGLRSEGGEERSDDAEVLEGTEDGCIELWGAIHEYEDPVGFLDAEIAEGVGEPVGEALHIRVGIVFDGARGRDPTHRHLIGSVVGVAVDRFVGKVEAAAVWEAVEFGADGIPVVCGATRFPVIEIGRDGELIERWLDDRLVVHGRPRRRRVA